MKVYKYVTLESLNDALIKFSENRVRVLHTKIFIKDNSEMYYVLTNENSLPDRFQKSDSPSTGG